MIDNVFVLCAGRCGSRTLAVACREIRNWSVGHESRASYLHGRLDYPPQHIEVDNRLSFFLGQLHEHYRDGPLYVHLTRNTEDTAKSFLRQGVNYNKGHGIIPAFIKSINRVPNIHSVDKLQAAMKYIEMTNSNIRLFLKDKPHVIHMNIEEPQDAFRKLWWLTEAKGDYEAACKKLGQRVNERIPPLQLAGTLT